MGNHRLYIACCDKMRLFTLCLIAFSFDYVILDQVLIEDVSAKQLEIAKETEKNLVIFWYSKNCKTCDKTYEILENIHENLLENDINLLSINDKKHAKKYNIRSFPSITYIRSGKETHYNGDYLNKNEIVTFFTNSTKTEALNINFVTVNELDELISTTKYLAVFFYNVEEMNPLSYLEPQFFQFLENENIVTVKSYDELEARRYGVSKLPSVIFFTKKVPKIYTGKMVEKKLTEWILAQIQRVLSEKNNYIVPVAYGLEEK